MAEDLENDKWVDIKISLSALSSGIIKAKKQLEEYSKELGWEIETAKKGVVDVDGERWYEITVAPKGGKISPEDLRERSDLIKGFAGAILRDTICQGNEERWQKNNINTWGFTTIDKKLCLNISFYTILSIVLDLKKAIKLDHESPNLFEKAFEISLKEWYLENVKKINGLFVSGEDKSNAERLTVILEENGMPKIHFVKKGFTRKLVDFLFCDD
ncbi:MAG: hypothetical protein LHV68_09850 [Elusimicrobia bacterium]|nr:hypothetical protein [Candidatus Liberimonas magnetica]